MQAVLATPGVDPAAPLTVGVALLMIAPGLRATRLEPWRSPVRRGSYGRKLEGRRCFNCAP